LVVIYQRRGRIVKKVSTSKEKKFILEVIFMKKMQDYAPDAAFYALPKAFIFRILPLLSPSTVKLFLALVYHTDPFNRIKYPEKITYSNIMNMTGIKKADTIRKAFSELVETKVISGFAPGFGSSPTRFYFTYDIDHYKTDESCLTISEIESYYRVITSKTVVSSQSNTAVFLPDEPTLEEYSELQEMEVHPSYQLESADFSTHEASESSTDRRANDTYAGTPSPQNLAGGDPENWHSLKTILAKCINSHSTTHANFNFNTQENSLNDTLDRNLVVQAKASIDFHRAFNEFCIKDSLRYREYTFFWVMYHASVHKLAIDELIESLKIACEKNKAGSMCYLIGIMKNKSKDKDAGVCAAGKNSIFSVMEYLKERMYLSWNYFSRVDIVDGKIVFEYKEPALKHDVRYVDYCHVITSEVNKRFRLSLGCLVA
jgi:hypothetical protein